MFGYEPTIYMPKVRLSLIAAGFMDGDVLKYDAL
jgi:hypothetical protein